ncbi:MAG: DUF883 family protein [Rhizobiales bacterium]|nr:DUF883 family protein [Hyphomicrobiales bacterium]
MSNMSNTARDTAKDARDAAKEAGNVASAGAGDIQEDLQALREDVTRLTQQLGGILAAKGNKVWARARSNVGGAVSDAQDKGMEAVGAVRDVGDNVVDAIDESLRTRPYTTLALVAAIGFLFGATWRR